ncbi:MAG: xanthine dehydrogenase family protein molybdopterin-binding subunit [Sarcina sp.]
MKVVNQSKPKVDSIPLITGKPVYTNDLAPANALIVKVLRAKVAHANIVDINTTIAEKVPGIECILTYEDVPKTRFMVAGQSYPEPTPYDRLILDKKVRHVGQAVAIVAGIDEKAVNKALKLIKIKYDILPAILDAKDAIDNLTIIHDEDDYFSNFDLGQDPKRNICSKGDMKKGDVEEVFKKCDIVLEETYHTKANAQAMMETMRTYTHYDCYGRLVIVSATQIPFHVRRILARALEIPKSKIRVIKPRIGGGFGAKQTVASEIYPAIVTLKTGKPAKICYSRTDTFVDTTSRHGMDVTVKLGADKDGTLRAMKIYALSNTGAYSEHGSTVVGLVGVKALAVYNRLEAYDFSYDVVYTNTMSAGAFRGYGATQGFFAVESIINELAAKINMDPTVIREKNIVKQGEYLPAYHGETLNSCHLDKCLAKAKELFKWDEKYPSRDLGNGKVRAVGAAVTMQGSGIEHLDKASVEIKLGDGGFYQLMLGSSDMGTGSDTIFAQMAAECLNCSFENITVSGVDTDMSPYDKGSYASSTTYVTGMAVIKTCEEMKKRICIEGSKELELKPEEVEFDGEFIKAIDSDKKISLEDLAERLLVGDKQSIVVSISHSSPVSPPPFMAGLVEIELDKETGKVSIVDYVAVVDCGTVINPALARIQAEGGLVQGIGMALFEDIQYNEVGRMMNDTFMQYKIPTRLDMGNIRVEFDSSYEPTGPFGAKSIGEVVINTPAPAIANAIYNAVGVNVRSLPMTAEKVLMAKYENMNK